MKIEAIKDFSPIKITFETQEEFDKFFAIVNFGPIHDTLGLYDFHKLLQPYSSVGYNQYHILLDNKLRRK